MWGWHARGFGRRWWFGRGWWWGFYGYRTPHGFTYVGPCRCGFGPHAFYVDDRGRLLHASQVYGWGAWIPPTPSGTQDETQYLKAEKADLEARLKEIEERLKEIESK